MILEKETSLFNDGAIGEIADKVEESQQHFWVTGTDPGSGVGKGVHITEVTKDDFIADPENGGGNTLITSDGMAIRDGSTELAIFGADGARIGDVNKAHSVIDDKGQRFYASDGTTQLANIGYGESALDSGVINPSSHYTFGVRETTLVTYDPSSTYNVGDMCIYDDKVYVCIYPITTAESWDANHWQYYIGSRSTAEGREITASGAYSHAEGFRTTTIGVSSHAQNLGTIATKYAQTAIGIYNKPDTSTTTTHPSHTERYGQYALIIGNGLRHTARSNAFTVDWRGNVEAAGALFSSGAEFSKKTGNHIVVGGIHICWGAETVAATANTYSEVQVTLPYTYQSNPICLASLGNRAAQARTAYATQGSLAGNKIYVGCYSTAARDIYISWMTIGA